MNKLTVYTSTGQPIQELDIGKDITAPFIYKLADIRKVGTKGGGHSKTVRLPGTKTNNQFFGGLYDVNVDYTTFNPNLKTFVRWVSADEETMSGFMKLAKVFVDDMDEVWYDVVIYDTTVDFWNEIEGKFLFENTYLDDLSHVWNGTNIKNSWTTDWDQLGYFYPALYNSVTPGYVQSGVYSPRTYTERLYPAIFHKRALDMIIKEAGYTWSGTLKENEVYEREIIPYTGDHPNVTLSEAEKRKFKAGFNSTPLGYTNLAPSVPNSGKIRNANRADWNYLGTQQFPDEAGGSYGFNDNFNLWASPLYTAPAGGKYAFNMNLIRETQIQYYKQGNPTNNLEYFVNFMVYAEIDTGTTVYTSTGVVLSSNEWWFNNSAGDTSGTFIEQTKIDTLVFPASSVGGLGGNTSGNYFLLGTGWTVRFYIGYSSTGLRKSKSGLPPYYSGNQDANKKFRIETVQYRLKAGSFVEVSDALSIYGEGYYTPYEAFINKKIKYKDLFNDIIARYNAHIYPNPDKEKDLVIDTGETFYNPDPADTVDWSHKKENDELDQIKHMAELQSERFLLTYKESGDDFTKTYKGVTGEIYGQHEHRFTNAFVKGVKKVETPFSDTPIAELDRMYYPAIEQGTKDGAMRVLYAPKGGVEMLEWNSLRYFKLIADDGIHLLGVSGSRYPYAGHLQNPNAVNDVTAYDVVDDNDINFGQCAYLFPQTMLGITSLPIHTLEFRYWRNRIDQMNRGKMLTTLLDLNSRDIQRIRKKPYTRIWINNAYWQANKIHYEGNDQLRKLTKVELVSIGNLKHIPGRIIKPVRPTIGDFPIKPVKDTSLTNYIGNTAVNWDVKGTYNEVQDKTEDVFIRGHENKVITGSRFVNIQNSNRVVVQGEYVTVIGTDDITVKGDNVTVINGVLYDGDKARALFNIIEGGEDEIRAIDTKSEINLIESGENSNLNRFAENPINMIDSETGLNNVILTDGTNPSRR